MTLQADIQTRYPSHTKQERYQLCPYEVGPFQQVIVHFEAEVADGLNSASMMNS
jgi:hypothetical protein